MCAKTGAFASPPSPSAQVSSPTVPAVARPRQTPGTTPAPVHVHLFLRSQSWLVHSFPRVSLYARHRIGVFSCCRDQYDRGTNVGSDTWASERRTTQRMTFLCSLQLDRDHPDLERSCRQGRPRQQERTRRRRSGGVSRWVRKMWASWACLVLQSQTATAAGTGPGNNVMVANSPPPSQRLQCNCPLTSASATGTIRLCSSAQWRWHWDRWDTESSQQLDW